MLASLAFAEWHRCVLTVSRVNALAPGLLDTKFSSAVVQNEDVLKKIGWPSVVIQRLPRVSKVMLSGHDIGLTLL